MSILRESDLAKPVGYYILNENDIDRCTTQSVIKEQANGKVMAKAIFQTADEVNRNGRIYPKSELFPQLTCPRTVELLRNKEFVGEAGHPLESSLTRQSTIDPTKVCFRILKFWTEGDNVVGYFEGTNNALGKALDEDLREGCKPAFSLRALGTIEKSPRGNIVHGMRMICYDRVYYPSHPHAYTQGIVDPSALTESSTIELPKSRLDQLLETTDYADVLCSESARVIPITNNSVVNFIKEDSKNVKFVTENFDIIYENAQISKDASSVTLNLKNGDSIIVNLESYVQNELMNYCSDMALLINK